MQKADIKTGVEHALRESRKANAPLQRVRILQHIRAKKWKAEWIDPNPGLVDYVESQDILVPWKHHKALLRDEEHDRRIQQENERHGFRNASPVENAVTQIFEASGEPLLHFSRGVLSGPSEAFDRMKTRAGSNSIKDSPFTYTDRFGTFHVPFDVAFDLAKAFCAAEPATVLVNIEATERKWTQQALQPGEEYIVSLLNEYRPSWALIRQWAGHDAAIAQREALIQQLERLVLDAIYALHKHGLEEEAQRLRRALKTS